MPNIRTRLAGLPPACLPKAAAWLHRHPLAVELLVLAAVIGLFTLEALR
ncbi:hypothetical protein [Pseudomonas fluvialis]